MEQTVYPKLPLFYEEWSNETTKLFFKCDEEVKTLCGQIKEFDLTEVKSLKIHYENDTVTGFTNKIRSIEGFRGLTTLAVKVSGRYIPDLDSRYFTADFNYGLCVIIQISKIIGYRMNTCESLLTWYQSIKKGVWGV